MALLEPRENLEVKERRGHQENRGTEVKEVRKDREESKALQVRSVHLDPKDTEDLLAWRETSGRGGGLDRVALWGTQEHEAPSARLESEDILVKMELKGQPDHLVLRAIRDTGVLQETEEGKAMQGQSLLPCLRGGTDDENDENETFTGCARLQGSVGQDGEVRTGGTHWGGRSQRPEGLTGTHGQSRALKAKKVQGENLGHEAEWDLLVLQVLVETKESRDQRGKVESLERKGPKDLLGKLELEASQGGLDLLDHLENLQGLSGLDGLLGVEGNEGDPGDAGFRGAAGTPGKQGTMGKPGPPGIRGNRGSGGLKGKTGQKGKHGPPGPMGPKGLPGLVGEKGQSGSVGRKGPPGDMGMLGTVGPPGLKGNPGLQGLKGPTGQKGKPGDKGPRGPPGRGGSFGISGQLGKKGIKGVQGGRGPKGFKGKRGPTGQPGPPGKLDHTQKRGSKSGPGQGLRNEQKPETRPSTSSNLTTSVQSPSFPKLKEGRQKQYRPIFKRWSKSDEAAESFSWPLGTKANPGTTCYEMRLLYPHLNDGYFYMDPNQGCPCDAVEVFCNFTAGGTTCIHPLHSQFTVRLKQQTVKQTTPVQWFTQEHGGQKFDYAGVDVVQLRFLRLNSRTSFQNVSLSFTANHSTDAGPAEPDSHVVHLLGDSGIQIDPRLVTVSRKGSEVHVAVKVLGNTEEHQGDMELLPVRELGIEMSRTSKGFSEIAVVLGPLCFL
ncbi:unnamed protein product [Menidia menidia]|uniref:(Atlantic silverside) hypothetical protein n=1 Tax=Menidia menidia TaxID=238744 RepID=A0A8S4AJC2_9TELE|nr:unnamed protein product [Menidia menidia]